MGKSFPYSPFNTCVTQALDYRQRGASQRTEKTFDDSELGFGTICQLDEELLVKDFSLPGTSRPGNIAITEWMASPARFAMSKTPEQNSSCCYLTFALFAFAREML
jgi:hypothetical protein